MKQKIRAGAYIRVSTDEQATEGQSLDSQLARITAYADSQGWELVGVYRDDGYSGKTIDRPQLKQLIDNIESGGLDVVLVYRIDRLSRRQKDVMTLLEDVFEPAGVGFKSVVEPFDTTTASGKAFLGMLAVFAQLERDQISERTADTLHHKKRVGEWVGRVPFGFRIGDDGCLEPDSDQQKTISRVRRMRGRGWSLRRIGEAVGLSYGTVLNLLKQGKRGRKSKYLNGINGKRAGDNVKKTTG